MVGTEIGNYKILEKVGEGGMGVVYKAVDINLDRTVAIKALNTELTGNPELEQRFRAEAKAQANLNHTNLATLYALLIEGGRPWMVMEFIEGETFEQMVQRRGPIPSQEAIPLFRQALLGIAYAHRMGVIHRDIKPSNMMLNKQGIVKVMDFGIAKVLGARGMTKTGTQLGTAFYMSPEQVLNRGVDIRTDIYSLGVTLYELLTANVPFNGDSDYQIMTDHVSAPPPLPTKFYPYIPQGLQNAVMKALEKTPDARFQTVEEFGTALDQPDTFGVIPIEVIPAPRGGATMVESAEPVVAVVAPIAAAVPAKPSFWTPERRIAIGAAGIIFALVAGWAALKPNVKNTGLPVQPSTVTPTQVAPENAADNGIPPLPPVKPETTSPQSQTPSQPATPTATVLAPAGTMVTVRMIDNVDSSRDRTGQRFAASVDLPVVVDGHTVIARGANARVVLYNAGTEVKLELVSVAGHIVRSNLFEKQAQHGKPKAGSIAKGAAVGAAIGGIFGRGKGAAAGAAAGGGGVAVAQSSALGPAIVPSETRIQFTLHTPITM
jgi:hypothetical protein